MTDTKALIAEARESADRVEHLGPAIASILRRLAAALEEAHDALDKIESMNRTGVEDICALARAAMEALEGGT